MPIKYEFQSILHRTEREMLDAIALEWLSAGGLNSEAEQAEFLRDNTDAELAAECIGGWGLDQGDDFDERPAHMEFNEYSADDLAAAFGRLRD